MDTQTQDTANGQYADNTIAAHRAALVRRFIVVNGRPPEPRAMGFPDLATATIAYLSAIRAQITHEEVTS